MEHTHLSGNHEEHMAALDLVKANDATHTAISSGDWFDPATWANGVVPGDDAKVFIPEGVEVDYAGQSDARIFSIGVEGKLAFDPEAVSKLVVDTMVVTPKGHLEIGTTDAPVTGEVDIVIANNGAIDTDWDAQLLSRGIVSLGKVDIHGAEVDSHQKVTTDPMAGDDVLTMEGGAPDGWQIGDTIIVAGTHNPGHSDDRYNPEYRGHTSEERTITRIEGDQVYLDEPLEYDHDTPREDLKTSVANMSRTVTVRSEDGADSEVYERGHVMMMGSDDVDIRFAAFDELGRTDKSELSKPTSDFDTIEFDSNVQGRYSLHLHQLGTANQDEPIMIEGNAVTGAPGWGIAQHMSHANLHNNATLDIWGASYVSETGDETGTWSDNISIGNVGTLSIERNHDDVAAGDVGKTGNGYWLESRLVDVVDNIAVGARTGFVWLGQGTTSTNDPNLIDQPEALGFGADVNVKDMAISLVADNEVFGSERGMTLTKGHPHQGHDVRTIVDGFDAWEVRSGIHALYTSHYTFLDIDLIAVSGDDPLAQPEHAISFENNASDMVIVEPKIEGFDYAYHFTDFFSANISTTLDDKQFIIIGGELIDLKSGVFVTDDWENRTTLVDPADINIQTPTVDVAVTPIGASKSGIEFTGTRVDSLGEGPLALGSDNIELKNDDVRYILENDGYFQHEGRDVAIVENFYQDRVTGELIKVGHLVEIDRDGVLLKSFFNSAIDRGPLPENNEAPVVEDETGETYEREPVRIELLANDSDENGAIKVDGLVQPKHGKVVDNGDGSVEYRPDAGFTGTETFEYWVTDGFGAFTKGYVDVTVHDGPPPEGWDSGVEDTGGDHDQPMPDHPMPDDPMPDGPMPDHPMPDGPMPDGPMPDEPMPDTPTPDEGDDATPPEGGDTPPEANEADDSGGGFFDWLISLFKSLFGGGSDTAAPPMATDPSATTEAASYIDFPTVEVSENDMPPPDDEEEEDPLELL